MRQLLLESLVLAIAGGAAGAVVALWGVDALVRISPVQIPRLNTVHIDRGVLVFTLAASMLTGALCGLLPALQLSRSNPGDALKDGDRGGSSGRGARTRYALVVAEVALSLMLLASAGLLIRTLGRAAARQSRVQARARHHDAAAAAANALWQRRIDDRLLSTAP